MEDTIIIFENEEQLSQNETSQEYEKKFWTYDQTMLLITIVESRWDELHHPRKRKYVWQNVATDIGSHDINVTSISCKKKWQNLLRSYKTCKDNKKKTGRGPTRFEFFNKMDELLGNQPNISSPHSINSIVSEPDNPIEEQCENVKNMDENHDTNQQVVTTPASTANEPIVTTPTSTSNDTNTNKIRKNARLDYIKSKKDFFERKEDEWQKRKKYTNEKDNIKIELFKKKLELEERKIAALEELVNLKKKVVLTNS